MVREGVPVARVDPTDKEVRLIAFCDSTDEVARCV